MPLFPVSSPVRLQANSVFSYGRFSEHSDVASMGLLSRLLKGATSFLPFFQISPLSQAARCDHAGRPPQRPDPPLLAFSPNLVDLVRIRIPVPASDAQIATSGNAGTSIAAPHPSPKSPLPGSPSNQRGATPDAKIASSGPSAQPERRRSGAPNRHLRPTGRPKKARPRIRNRRFLAPRASRKGFRFAPTPFSICFAVFTGAHAHMTRPQPLPQTQPQTQPQLPPEPRTRISKRI